MSRYSDTNPLIIESPSDNQQERRWYYTNFRKAFGQSGSAYGIARTEDDRWLVDCHLPDGRKLKLGTWNEWEEALKIQDYCVQRDVMVKMALIELYEHANYEALESLLTDALLFGRLPRRRVRVTLEVDIEMRGTDEEISSYLLLHVRSGTAIKTARVAGIDGPRLEEPHK